MARFKVCVNVHVFFCRGDDVLLLRRRNTGYEDGNYSVVAGHLDGGETVIQAAVREAAEEAGVTLTEDDVRVIGTMHRKSNDERIDFFLTASSWSGEITNAEPHKCDDLAWFSRDALPQNTVAYVRRALEHARTEPWFDTYGWDERA